MLEGLDDREVFKTLAFTTMKLHCKSFEKTLSTYKTSRLICLDLPKCFPHTKVEMPKSRKYTLQQGNLNKLNTSFSLLTEFQSCFRRQDRNIPFSYLCLSTQTSIHTFPYTTHIIASYNKSFRIHSLHGLTILYWLCFSSHTFGHLYLSFLDCSL